MDNLYKLDLIGSRPGLYVNNYSYHKFSLGGLFTIITFMLGTLCIIGFGLDIFEKRKPEILTSKELNYTNFINASNLLFAVAPMMIGGQIIPDLKRRLNLMIQYSETVANETKLFYLPMIPCREARLYKQNLFNFSSLLISDIDQYFCLPEDKALTLKGKFGNSEFNMIELHL
jgi:hypothetical protein